MPTPDALLLIAPGCPHCPAVLEGLAALVKEGAIGALEVVNVAVHPERAAAAGVRSVPWCRIGPIELSGAQSPGELRRWAEEAASDQGVTRWLGERLANGDLTHAEATVRKHPTLLIPLVGLLEDPDTPMQVRVGIGAIFEMLHGSGLAAVAAAELCRLSTHPDARIRADATLYLGYSETTEARPCLQARLDDADPDVREIAEESLDRLRPLDAP
ncbi:thioredoxin family protein [Endothiovibrio diazotrophicus]